MPFVLEFFKIIEFMLDNFILFFLFECTDALNDEILMGDNYLPKKLFHYNFRTTPVRVKVKSCKEVGYLNKYPSRSC